MRNAQADDTLLPSARALTPEDALARANQSVDEQKSRLQVEAQRIARETQAHLVTFGHTHMPEVISLEGGATYINSGTWIWNGNFSHATAAQWEDLFRRPSNYATQRRLTYVRVDYDATGKPTVRLLEVGAPTPPVVDATGAGNVHPAPAPSSRRGCLPALLMLPWRH